MRIKITMLTKPPVCPIRKGKKRAKLSLPPKMRVMIKLMADRADAIMPHHAQMMPPI
jgi:hypothetical protein